ncbi:MAG: hypothetical protein ACOYL6_10800 [Bacteriovoracaceae bacterium]
MTEIILMKLKDSLFIFKILLIGIFVLEIENAKAQDERCRETTGPERPIKKRSFECIVKRVVSPQNELEELSKIIKEKREEVAGYISTMVYVISELSVSQTGNNKAPIESFKQQSGNLILQDLEYQFESRRTQDTIEWTIHFSVDESAAKQKFDQFMLTVSVNHSALVFDDLKKQMEKVECGSNTDGLDLTSINPCDIEYNSKFKTADQQWLDNGEAFERQAERLQLLQTLFLEAQKKFVKITGPENKDELEIEGRNFSVQDVKQFLNLRTNKLNSLSADPAGLERAFEMFEQTESTAYGLRGSSAKKAYEKYLNSSLSSLAKAIDGAMGVPNYSSTKLTLDDRSGLKVASICFDHNKLESNKMNATQSDFDFLEAPDACHDLSVEGKKWDPYEWIQNSKATTNNESSKVFFDGLSRVLSVPKKLDCETTLSDLNARGRMRALELNFAKDLPGLKHQLRAIRLTPNQFQKIFDKDFSDFTQKHSLPKLDAIIPGKAGSSTPKNVDKLFKQMDKFNDSYLSKWEEFLVNRYGTEAQKKRGTVSIKY